jgi:hypothetical protein
MNDELSNLLELYPAEVQDLALKVREVILAGLPGVIEMVDIPSKIIGYGYGRRYADLICGIAPFKTYVNLMFGRGIELPDPAGLLVGTGKRARHVKLKTIEDADHPALGELLAEALKLMKS